MAEPYDSIRESLARSRVKGRPFARAWEDALSWAHAGHGEIRTILDATVGAWRRAYQGEPQTRGEAALTMLTEGRELLSERPEHPCAHCDGEIPAARLKHGADFCTERCRARASWQRERERLAA